MSSSDTKETPLPKKQLIPLMLVQCCEAGQMTFLFPFLVFMVLDFQIAPTPESVGNYVGLIAASFPGAQFVSSLCWGILSDRIGRKRSLLLGLLGSAIGVLCFGFSTKFWAAMLTRAMSGLLNGNIGIIKSFMGEITDETNRSRGFSLLPVCWGTAVIVAPLVGGSLAKPVQQYPGLFKPGSFFDKFPYLLPCLVLVSFTLVTYVVSHICLEEPVPGAQSSKRLFDSDEEMKTLSNEEKTYGTTTTTMDNASDHQNGKDQLASTKEKSSLTLKETVKVLFKTDPFVACSIYGLIALVYILFDEAVPLYFSASPETSGGLGFDSKQIGIAVGTSGIFLLLWTLFVVPTVIKRLGVLRCFRLSGLLVAPFLALLPCLTFLLNQPAVLWTCLMIIFALKQTLSSHLFVTVLVFVNDSVSPEYLGSVNGMGQSFAALARCIGPAVGGSLWALSINPNAPFPRSRFFLFVLSGALNIVAVSLTFLLQDKWTVPPTPPPKQPIEP